MNLLRNAINVGQNVFVMYCGRPVGVVGKDFTYKVVKETNTFWFLVRNRDGDQLRVRKTDPYRSIYPV